MIILPAIDLFGGRAVRLLRGDYNQMTVYPQTPAELAKKFKTAGCTWAHLVDLEGARDGGTPNLDTILNLKKTSGLSCEVGGGIRDMSVVEKYLAAGLDRVILGTAAVKDPAFLEAAVKKYKEKIAVGVDIANGRVAVKGWTETTDLDAMDFLTYLDGLGVRTVICTDISRDGTLCGANDGLYKNISEKCSFGLIASGGVKDIQDVKRLAGLSLYGAIVGKAYLEGTLDLNDAVVAAGGKEEDA